MPAPQHTERPASLAYLNASVWSLLCWSHHDLFMNLCTELFTWLCGIYDAAKFSDEARYSVGVLSPLFVIKLQTSDMTAQTIDKQDMVHELPLYICNADLPETCLD